MFNNNITNDKLFKRKKSCPKKRLIKLFDLTGFIKNVKIEYHIV